MAVALNHWSLHKLDNTFKCIFLNESYWVLIQILFTIVQFAIGPLVISHQCYTGRSLAPKGDKPLPEPMMTTFRDAMGCHQWVNALRSNDAYISLQVDFFQIMTYLLFATKL